MTQGPARSPDQLHRNDMVRTACGCTAMIEKIVPTGDGWIVSFALMNGAMRGGRYDQKVPRGLRILLK